jgi:hypothetical protein
MPSGTKIDAPTGLLLTQSMMRLLQGVLEVQQPNGAS